MFKTICGQRQRARSIYRAAHAGLPDGVGVGGAVVHGDDHGVDVLLRGVLRHRQPGADQVDRAERAAVRVEPGVLHLGGGGPRASGRLQRVGLGQRPVVGPERQSDHVHGLHRVVGAYRPHDIGRVHRRHPPSSRQAAAHSRIGQNPRF